MKNSTRSRLKIRDCAPEQGSRRPSSAVYMLIHEQRRTTCNAVLACKINFEMASRTVCWIAVMCALLLSSCDGGLFGTGDGHNNDMMVDGTGGTTGNDTSVGGNGDTGNTSGGTGGTDGEGSTQDEVEFDNQEASSQIDAAQLRVINLSNRQLTIVANDSGNDALAAVDAGEDSGLISLTSDVSSLLFTATDDSAQTSALQSVDRFNAVPFSVTTLFARGTDDDISIAPLVTRVSSTSPDTALVRLIQASKLGDAAKTADITLTAIEPDSSGSDVIFSELSFNSIATEYVVVIPGSYSVIDTDSRFASESTSVEAGKVYSLIIGNTTAPVLRVIVDSD